jgi:MFS family permease
VTVLREALQLGALRALSRDGRVLFLTRAIRLSAYGLISVVLVLYLAKLGFSGPQIGLLLTLTLVGDTIITLGITTTADRVGRRRMLVVGAALMFGAGIVFALSGNYWVLLLAATIGVISPSGNEVGPFLSIEQAGLAQRLPAEHRTGAFAWYNLCGAAATALGALVGGVTVDALGYWGWPLVRSYQALLCAYAALGLTLAGLFVLLSPAVEASGAARGRGRAALLGLHRSKGVVAKLSALFALDAFGGGFVIQSIVAYWFHVRFGASPGTLGVIFFGANLLAGFSALAAAALARRIGLVRTMVFTHIPSNVLLILVPLMPSLASAIGVLLLRFSISQMDVPTRQSYTMAMVDPDERSAAAGITGIARTTGAAISPSLAGLLLATPALVSAPFFLAGGIKIVYDLLLYRSFRNVCPPAQDAPVCGTVPEKGTQRAELNVPVTLTGHKPL